jgi:hypothetical protein
MGKTAAPPVVLDAGALIALERGDPRMRTLCREGLRGAARLVIPAGVLAQVARGGGRQHALRALLAAAMTEVPALDRVLAEAVGDLCGRTSTTDVVDASVVLTARRMKAPVVTSDAGDLRRLDAHLRIEVV